MKYFLVIGMFFSASLFGGIEGTYTIDKDSMLGAIDGIIDAQVAKMPADQQDQARAQMEGMKPMMVQMIQNIVMEIEVKGDGTLAYKMTDPNGQPEDGSGTWSRDGDNVTFTSDKDGKEQSISGTVKGDKIHLQVPNMPLEMVLVKK